MKVFLLTCLAFLFLSNYSDRALGQPILIQKLKENKKVDEVMDRAMKDEPEQQQLDKNNLLDSCWYLQIFRWGDGNTFSFQIKPSSKRALNFVVNELENEKKTYGFFIYKGNLVVTWCSQNLPDLFVVTGSRRSFRFLVSENFTNETEASLHLYSIHYKMTDGVISVEGPPPVMSLKNK